MLQNLGPFLAAKHEIGRDEELTVSRATSPSWLATTIRGQTRYQPPTKFNTRADMRRGAQIKTVNCRRNE